MKAKEIREKSEAELMTALQDRRKQLFAVRTQTATEKVQDTSQIGKARRDIARIKTVLAQRSATAGTGVPAKA